MSMPLAIMLLVVGLALLWKSAEFLVSGAVSLAQRLGVSPLVIGLTIVAMGTSAPEVAASIAAALRGNGDSAIGNVYGSNIANLALVGGLCALIRPISVRLQTLKHEIPAMLVVALLLWPVLHNLNLARTEGIMLLVVFACLIGLTVYLARKEAPGPAGADKTIKQVKEAKSMGLVRIVIFIVGGLVGLAVGAEMTVAAAVYVGTAIGLSKAVIGLTIIAVGTSLPELATCVVAAMKGQDDISIGNLVGSNIFNTLLVVGAAGTVRPFEIVQRLAGADYWIMVVLSAVFMVMALVGRKISRIDGVLLVGAYVGYMVYLFGFTASI